MQLDSAREPESPRWHLLLPVAVIAIAALLTPGSELHSNQGDVGLYLGKARALASGQVPYRDFSFEYPPFALVPMVVPYLAWPFGTVNLDAYHWLFAAWEMSLMLALGVVLARIVRLGGGPERDGAAIAGVPRSMAVRLTIVAIGTALALAWRYDLYPALLVTVALWAALEGRAGAAGLAIGLGILAKLYPLAVVPALAVPWLFPLDFARVIRYGAIVALTVVFGLLPFVALAGNDAFGFLSYHSLRGLQVESIGGGLALLGGLVGGHLADVSFGFSAVQVDGPFARTWLALLPPVTAIGFGLLGLLGWRRIRADRAVAGVVPAATVVALAGASVLMLLATSKVFSIQYVVWIVPFAALLRGRQFWLAVAIIALTMPIHPMLYGELVRQQELPILILNVRNGLLLALLARILWDLAKGVARPAGLEPTTFRSAT